MIAKPTIWDRITGKVAREESARTARFHLRQSLHASMMLKEDIRARDAAIQELEQKQQRLLAQTKKLKAKVKALEAELQAKPNIRLVASNN